MWLGDWGSWSLEGEKSKRGWWKWSILDRPNGHPHEDEDDGVVEHNDWDLRPKSSMLVFSPYQWCWCWLEGSGTVRRGKWVISWRGGDIMLNYINWSLSSIRVIVFTRRETVLLRCLVQCGIGNECFERESNEIKWLNPTSLSMEWLYLASNLISFTVTISWISGG